MENTEVETMQVDVRESNMSRAQSVAEDRAGQRRVSDLTGRFNRMVVLMPDSAKKEQQQ